MELKDTKTEIQHACPYCKEHKLECEPFHDLWSIGRVFQTSAGYLRVRVVEGDPISRMLISGETPYLTAVTKIQIAQYQNSELDKESEALIAHFSRRSAPDEYSTINCLDPWLFRANERSEIQEEQRNFYRKVWRLLNHVNHQIQFTKSRHLMDLRLTTPKYSTLEVIINVRKFGLRRKEESILLGQGDTEGSFYTLSRNHIQNHSDSAFTEHGTDLLRPRCNAPDDHRTSSQTFRNENNKRVRADEDSLAGSCRPDSSNAKGFHLSLTSSSTSSLQSYGDTKPSIASTTTEHIATPHVSSLSSLDTPIKAESLSEKGEETEESEEAEEVKSEEDEEVKSEEDEEVKEDKEDEEKKRIKEISRNDDKSGRSDGSLIGHDIPMGTSCSGKMYQPLPVSTFVTPWNGPPWDNYTEGVAYQWNEMTTTKPIVDNSPLDENIKAKQLRDFRTDSTNGTYNDPAPNMRYYWNNPLSSAAPYIPTTHKGWEEMSNATSNIPPQHSYYHHAHVASGDPTHYQTR